MQILNMANQGASAEEIEALYGGGRAIGGKETKAWADRHTNKLV